VGPGADTPGPCGRSALRLWELGGIPQPQPHYRRRAFSRGGPLFSLGAPMSPAQLLNCHNNMAENGLFLDEIGAKQRLWYTNYFLTGRSSRRRALLSKNETR
jgi:hypothetical protein